MSGRYDELVPVEGDTDPDTPATAQEVDPNPTQASSRHVETEKWGSAGSAESAVGIAHLVRIGDVATEARDVARAEALAWREVRQAALLLMRNLQVALMLGLSILGIGMLALAAALAMWLVRLLVG